ncbi:MAG: asparagine synthase (glutamine-hydrolyzing) [Calditrichia bacterium]
MCGISGIVAKNGNCDLLENITRMTSILEKRGPDDFGYWLDPEYGVALGHRRLSIIDVSPSGHQPMVSSDGRYVIVLNGEIYNYLEIKEKIEIFDQGKGFHTKWKGTSDTEILLESVCRFGIEETLRLSKGMFAFAVWDRRNKKLFLARDRMGEKPLFYSHNSEGLCFGSSVKALKQSDFIKPGLNKKALNLYFKYNYIPAPLSIYEEIFKLLPAHYLVYDLKLNKIAIKEYWSLKKIILQGRETLFSGTEEQALDELDNILTTVLKRQSISDVPIGAFLSGGIDSSTIVAFFQKISKEPINTFTIGFNHEGYNEAEYAKSIAKFLKTNHTELYLDPKQALEVIPQIPKIFDEPFGDASQIPTYIVSKLAREQVTVALSGDGGDENFAGYIRHYMTPTLWKKLKKIPLPLRKMVSRGILKIPPAQLDNVYGSLKKIINFPDYPNMGNYLHKIAGAIPATEPLGIYHHLVSHWEKSIIRGESDPDNFNISIDGNGIDLVDQMIFLDQMTYLPDDILVKVDRAAMGVSLESRAPFLDPDVVEFAWRLPNAFKIKDGQGKWILKRLLSRYLPKELIDRPKMGFSLPIDEWLRTDLKNWMLELLDKQKLMEQGILDADYINLKIEQHLSGRYNWALRLWNVLMFQLWLEENE